MGFGSWSITAGDNSDKELLEVLILARPDGHLSFLERIFRFALGGQNGNFSKFGNCGFCKNITSLRFSGLFSGQLPS